MIQPTTVQTVNSPSMFKKSFLQPVKISLKEVAMDGPRRGCRHVVGIFRIQSLRGGKLEDTERIETRKHKRRSSNATVSKKNSSGSHWKQFTSAM